jgi:hypothetical protein
MDSKPRHTSVWKILGALFGTVVCLIIGFGWWIHRVAERRHAAVEKKLKAMSVQALVSAADTKRPVLHGQPVPGNAWVDYVKALSDVNKLKQPDRLAGLMARTLNPDNKAFEEAALRAHSAVMDHIVRGARRDESCYPPDQSWPQVSRSAEFAIRLAILKSRSLEAEGKIQESMGLLLDLCQFSRDVAAAGPWMLEGQGLRALGWVLDEIHDQVLKERCGQDLDRELEHSFETLDETFPRHDRANLNQALWLGKDRCDGPSPDGIQAHLQCWRFGFSTRIFVIESFDRWSEWLRRSAEVEERPWLEAQSEISKIRSEISQCREEATGYGGGFLQDGYIGRMTRARLRLLRVALHYRRTGEILELEDPFGRKLLHEEKNGHLRVWSIDRDGKDHGGVGSWKSDQGKDLLLEVER